MVEAAVGSVEGLEASRIEIDRGGLSFTADTLDDLQAEAPDRELFVVLGSDAAGGLPSWERADEVRRSPRSSWSSGPGHRDADPPPGWSWVQVEVPRLEVSSTDLRARVADGRPLDYLLTPRRDRGRARARPVPDRRWSRDGRRRVRRAPDRARSRPARPPADEPAGPAATGAGRRARPVRECGYRGRRPAPRGPGDSPRPGAGDGPGSAVAARSCSPGWGPSRSPGAGARRRRALRRAQQHGRSLPAGAGAVRARAPGERGAHPHDGPADAVRRRPSGRRRRAGPRARATPAARWCSCRPPPSSPTRPGPSTPSTRSTPVRAPRRPPQALAAGLTVAVNETVEIDDADVDPVRRARRTGHRRPRRPVGEWAAGEVVLPPEDVGRFLATAAADEPDLARVERQQAFWDGVVANGPRRRRGALPGEVETGVGRFVRVIAAGEGRPAAIPVGREDTADGVRYRPRPRAARPVRVGTIPYPTSPAPGVRIRDPAAQRHRRPGAHRTRPSGRWSASGA